jgi:hypothetical protein
VEICVQPLNLFVLLESQMCVCRMHTMLFSCTLLFCLLFHLRQTHGRMEAAGI